MNTSLEQATAIAEASQETWTQILFAPQGQNDPLSCYEVGFETVA